MSLLEFTSALEQLATEAEQSLATVADVATLEELRVRFVGAKNGQLKSIQKMLGTIPNDQKPAAGKQFNEVRDRIQTALDNAQSRLSSGSTSPKAKGPLPDPTLPGIRPTLGHLHPITQTIETLKDIMGRLGFSATEGPRSKILGIILLR